MDAVLERIAAWEAAGLIDAETAARLRASEADRLDLDAPAPDARPDNRRGPSTVAQIFGPAVSIGEMFAYLGGAFLLGALDAFLTRTAGLDGSYPGILVVGFGVAAAVLVAIGLFLRKGDARRRRAAGVAFAAAVAHAATAGAALMATIDFDVSAAGVGVSLIALALAVLLRSLHPAVLTQFTMLASLTALAATLLSALERVFVPEPVFSETGAVDIGGPNPRVLLIASAAYWLVFALLLGVLALLEARLAGDPAAGRRVSLTRLWAGLAAVAGLASAVTRSDYLSADGNHGRVLEPWVGDLALVVLAVILVERAFRRGANTFVYAAALALIIALTDFNFSYLSDSTEVGLLIEGVILLGAGFTADRLRRRIDADETAEPAAAEPAQPPAA